MRRHVVAEGLGTALLLYVIVGSGIAAQTLSRDGAVQLLAHALVVGLGLAVLIVMLQTVSGSHFNPSVTIGFWRTGGIRGVAAARFTAAQVTGAVVGVVAASLSFDLPAVSISGTARTGLGLIVAEGIGTFVLVLVVLALVRTGRSKAVPAAVGAWVASIVFATSSTGFVNPAVTIARIFTDTYTGIAPVSAIGYLVAQVAAGFVASAVAPVLFPEPVPLEASTT